MDKKKISTNKNSQLQTPKEAKTVTKKATIRTQSVSPQIKLFAKESIINTYAALATPSPQKSLNQKELAKIKKNVVNQLKNKSSLMASGIAVVLQKPVQKLSSNNLSSASSKADCLIDNGKNMKNLSSFTEVNVCLNTQNKENNCQQNATKDKKAKKDKKTALKDLKPLNLEKEKELFFKSNFTYNPNFLYQLSDINLNYSVPHTKYFDLALKILNEVIKIYGSEHKFNEEEGGQIIDIPTTTSFFEKYVKDLECEDLVTYEFQSNTISPTCCQHNKDGTSKIIIGLPILYRELRIQGVLNHEIGTHFLRKHNERQQVWFKQRKKFGLEPSSKVEEGLALVNQKYDLALNQSQKPFVFNAALHYYASVKSSQMSFSELFNDLEKYVKDPDKRWRECLRVKRGISDTSQHLGMYKDQIYLIGIRRVLKYRNKIDLVKLHSGKITVKDCIKLTEKNLINTEKIKIPYFLKDINLYKKALDRIAEVNFMSDITVL
ncbi:hypothetical protein TTHERM_01042050 (macronuclear) [Tetrahymena thermophila SB210]|uniref:Uncharacterized protein n=1 Tax=Tetrahymena thermophila (strain SB210) TaxID=312017 RepID=Q24D80_TETTS|nr:hypothetical protein TTHERM_01042050 [Tetrahymena thermophila SB210]EAS05765.2 hypothetical protein TTHERM_01042050 [Tetrahymena thermophila SB210]|eukprot:XP_001026010.2 hypothetical protein TTHERM_01042050 [Tetrahymena thermophila SB210]